MDPVVLQQPVTIEAFELTLDEAASVFAIAASVVRRLEEGEVDERKPSAPLPRGALNCGEAVQLLPLLMCLLVKEFPQLLDEDVLAVALRMCARPLPSTH